MKARANLYQDHLQMYPQLEPRRISQEFLGGSVHKSHQGISI